MDEDIYFFDARNATNDHRTQSGGSRPGGRPTSAVVVPGSGSSRVYTAQPAYPYGQYPQYPYGQAPYMMPPQSAASTLLGRVSAGQLIDLVAQIFAALMPLPGAPTTTSDAVTDVGNLIVYQGALAQYAKRDEQVRTLGNLVTKLVG